MLENRVGFGPRLGAVFLEGIIYVILLFITVDVLLGGNFIANMGRAASDETEPISIFLFTSAVFMIPFVIEAATGVTLGKLILGIRPVYEDGRAGDTALFLKRALIRNLPNLTGQASMLLALADTEAGEGLQRLSSMISGIFLIGCLFALGTKRQALHDMIVKSAIVRKEHVGIVVDEEVLV